MRYPDDLLEDEPRPDPAYLVFNAEIRAKSVDAAMDEISELKRKGYNKLYMAISSEGGNVTSGIELYNFLRAMPIELQTHNIGDVDSIANVIFLAGRQRYANSNTRFMMHGVSRGFDVKGDAKAVWLSEKQLIEGLAATQLDHDRIARMVAQHTKMTFEQVRAMIDDKMFTPEEALEKGMIDAIKEFEIPKRAKIVQIHD